MNELESLYKSNQFNSLEDKTKKLIKSYPHVSILYNILGVALQKKGNFDESIFNLSLLITSTRLEINTYPQTSTISSSGFIR